MAASEFGPGTIPEEGTQRPSLRFLNRHVRDSVGLKWHDLGIELLDSEDVDRLDTIEAEHPSDHEKCCTKMFKLWLKKQPSASWNQLVEALRQPDIELDTLATKIEGMLLQTKPKKQPTPHSTPHSMVVDTQSALISVTSLNADFTRLLINVCYILSNVPDNKVNLEGCKDYCALLRINDGSNESLFSAERISKIKECSDFKQLFEIISLHMSWDEHSILTQIVDQCNSVEGQQEIEKFEKKLALYQGLQIISTTSQQNLSKDFARFRIIINKPYKSVTIEEYMNIKAYIFGHLETKPYVAYRFIGILYHSLHIDWLITAQAVPHMIENADHCKDVFIQEKFVFMQIGIKVVIDNEGLFTQILSTKRIFELKEYLVKQETYITKITEGDDVASSDKPLHFELSRKTSTADSFDEQTILHGTGYFKPFTVADKFSHVTEEVTKLLQSLDPKLLVEQCDMIMASDGIKFFSDDQIQQLNAYSDTPLLLQHLSYLWSWSNHSVLRILVGFCDEAIKLLDEFDCHLDPFEPITSYLIFEILPNDVDITTQTVFNVKFTEGTSKVTLQDVFDMCSLVINKYGISQYCPQLIATQQAEGFITIYWSIPNCVVNLISSKTLHSISKLYDMGVLEVKIYPDIKIVTGATFDFEEEASRMHNLTKQLRHVNRQYMSAFNEVKRLKQDESALLNSLKTLEQKFEELGKQPVEINENQKERIAGQESECIEALEKVIMTLSTTADVTIFGKAKEVAFETTTAVERLQHHGYEIDDVKEMIEHTHCYARKVKEQYLALYEICKGGSSSDQKALQQSSENVMLKAELETLKQEHRRLINIHTKSKIQKDKMSITTQTEFAAELEEANQEMSQQQHQLQCAEQMNKQLKEELETLRIDRQKQQLKQDNNDLQTQIDKLKVDLDEALTSKTEMEAVVSQKQDLLSQWESQIADVIQWVSDEKSARTYLNSVAIRLKDDVDTLKNNFTALNRREESWRTLRSNKREKMELLEKQLELNNEIRAKEELQQECTQRRQQLTETEMWLAISETNNDQLKMEVEILKQRLLQARQAVHHMENQTNVIHQKQQQPCDMFTPQNKSAGSKHEFVVRSFEVLTRCDHCSSVMIGLVRQGMVCKTCACSCHIRCADKLPICPIPPSQISSSGLDGFHGVGTALEGWVHIPKPGGVLKGWTRHYAIICDFKLFIHNIQADTPTMSVSHLFDIKDEKFLVMRVTKSDVIHANPRHLPCILKVTTGVTMQRLGSELFILMETQGEMEKWLAMLEELSKVVRSKQHLPQMFTPRKIYEQQIEKDAIKINCALVLDPLRILLGAEDGLMMFDCNEEVPLKLGERKVTYLERCENIIVYMGQRNRCPCFTNANLIGPGAKQDLDASSVKVVDARSCQLIAIGMVGNALCMCTTNRKKVSVYELNPKKLQSSKLKEINAPHHIQWVGLLSGQLCVGYVSGFTMFSIQGEMIPLKLINGDDLTLGFIRVNDLNCLECVELNGGKEFLLCFHMFAVYVDLTGKRSRKEELVWHSTPYDICYNEPYLLVFTECCIEVYHVPTAYWIQNVPIRKARNLHKNGILLQLCEGAFSLVYLHKHGTEDEIQAKRLIGARRRANTRIGSSRPLISKPLDFRHEQHIGLDNLGVSNEHSSGTVTSHSMQAGLNQTSGDLYSLTKVSANDTTAQQSGDGSTQQTTEEGTRATSPPKLTEQDIEQTLDSIPDAHTGKVTSNLTDQQKQTQPVPVAPPPSAKELQQKEKPLSPDANKLPPPLPSIDITLKQERSTKGPLSPKPKETTEGPLSPKGKASITVKLVENDRSSEKETTM